MSWRIEGRGEIKKEKNEKEKVKEKRKGNENKKEKRRVLWTFHSLTHLPRTTRRSCFAKRFSKTVLPSPANPLHQHSHSWSCHSHSCAKRTIELDNL
jgi:hypothetical protein